MIKSSFIIFSNVYSKAKVAKKNVKPNIGAQRLHISAKMRAECTPGSDGPKTVPSRQARTRKGPAISGSAREHPAGPLPVPSGSFAPPPPIIGRSSADPLQPLPPQAPASLPVPHISYFWPEKLKKPQKCLPLRIAVHGARKKPI